MADDDLVSVTVGDDLTSETMSLTDSNASTRSSERREMMLELKMLRNAGSEDGESDEEDNDTIDSDLLPPERDALDDLFEDEAEEEGDDNEEDDSEEDNNSEPSHWDSEQQSLFESEDFEQGVADDERYPLQRLCDEFQRNGYTLYHALMLLTKRCPTDVDGRDAYLQLRDDLDLMHLRLQIQYEEECAAGGAPLKQPVVAVWSGDETVVLNSDDENMVEEESSDEESERPVRKKKAVARGVDMWCDEDKEEAEL